MLFHLTIAHRAEDCPGSRLDTLPELATGGTFGNGIRLIFWEAACLLFGDGQHEAFALVEAESLADALAEVHGKIPAGWECRGRAVWQVPHQLPLAREALAVLASAAPFGTDSEPGEFSDVDSATIVASPQSPQAEAEEPSIAGTVATTDFRTQTTPAEGDVELTPPKYSDAAEDAALQDLPTEVLPSVARPSAAPALRLVAEDGSADYEVGQEGATLGRAPSNAVVLADERASSQHARIEWRGDSYWLIDLQSTNGVAVNGFRVTEPYQLHDRDVLTIGRTRLVARSVPT